MELPTVLKLNLNQSSTIYSIKLNHELVSKFKDKSIKPKLIIKNGKISIKIDEIIYNFQTSNEFLNLNIYSRCLDDQQDGTPNHVKEYTFEGNVKQKLAITNDRESARQQEQQNLREREKLRERERLKERDKLDERERSLTPMPTYQHLSEASTPLAEGNQPLNFQDYKITADDSTEIIKQKFLSCLSLGPTNVTKLAELNYDFSSFINQYCSTYEQLINLPSFKHLDNEIFANGLKLSPSNNLILKDKIIKDLRPNNWPWVKDEKFIVFQNIHNCLTRLGYSPSHPLRKRIYESAQEEDKEGYHDKERSKLGGGLLISKASTTHSGGKTNNSHAGSTGATNSGRTNNIHAKSPNISPAVAVPSSAPSSASALTSSTAASASVTKLASSALPKSASSKSASSKSASNKSASTKSASTKSASAPASASSLTSYTSINNSSITPNNKRKGPPDSDETSPSSIEDFFLDDNVINSLINKFYDNYNTYKKLYKSLESNKSKDISQLNKLFDLHMYCKQLKGQLINISKDKRRKK